MKTFHDLYLEQCPERIVELISTTRNGAELARIRSRKFERELIEAARRAAIPGGASILYRSVGISQSGSYANAIARAQLIQAFCASHGVEGFPLSQGWNDEINIHIYSTDVGCLQLDYQLGLLRVSIERKCEMWGVSSRSVVPFIDEVTLNTRINPALTFPFTPDCDETFRKFLRFAN